MTAPARLGPPYLGAVEARGFVIDPAVLGDPAARRRVLEHWAPGAELLVLPDGAWLLLLARPVRVRCESAPGLPVLDGPDGLQRPTRGRTEPVAPVGLARLDPAAWLRLDLPPAVLLTPVEAATTPAVPEPVRPAPPPDPDRRVRAGVGRRDPRDLALLRSFEERGARAATRHPFRRGGTGGAAPSLAGSLLARGLLRTPASQLVSRRQERYLRDLARAFETRDYERALRSAIGTSTGAGSFLTLRLPKPRTSITGPSRGPSAGGNALWGSTVQTFLHDHYRRAAEELERAGRIDEAAFVLVDLLGNVLGATALYERHGRYRDAADLAVGHDQSAEAQIRLLWLAGDRDRALDVARSRGSFAAAVERLAPVDPEAATQLRRAWVETLREAGDHLAAARVAWSDERLRPEARPDTVAGQGLGGPEAGRLLVLQLALDADAEAAERARALLRRPDPPTPEALGVVEELADHGCADPAVDRELTSAGLRLLLRPSVDLAWPARRRRQVYDALRARSEPVLRADAPASPAPAPADPGEPLRLHVPEGLGLVEPLDAVALRDGGVLVALGEEGVRLTGPDGRTRAAWRTPTTRILMSDHGGSALLARPLGFNVWQLHELDLADRRTSVRPRIRAYGLPEGTDGRSLAAYTDDHRISFLDVRRGDRPRVLWTEGNEREQVVAHARSADAMAALVNAYPDPGLPGQELWRWTLPDLRLQSRRRVAVDPQSTGFVLTATGRLVSVRLHELRWVATQHEPTAGPLSWQLGTVAPPRLLSSGALYGVLEQAPDHQRLEVARDHPQRPELVATLPLGSTPGFRHRPHATVLWTDHGQVLVLDLEARRALTSFDLGVG